MNLRQLESIRREFVEAACGADAHQPRLALANLAERANLASRTAAGTPERLQSLAVMLLWVLVAAANARQDIFACPCMTLNSEPSWTTCLAEIASCQRAPDDTIRSDEFYAALLLFVYRAAATQGYWRVQLHNATAAHMAEKRTQMINAGTVVA